MKTDSPDTWHADSIVIDAVAPLARCGPKYLEWYRAGGVTALAPSVLTTDLAATMHDLATWHALLAGRPDLRLVRQAADIEIAKHEGRIGIYFHFQGTDSIGTNLDLVSLFKVLGVGVIQLTYNAGNRVGDGCEEPEGAGLSRFGRALISRLNAARILVDCSHAGPRTALDAIANSSAPVILSHSNAAWVQPNPRNASRELVDAIAHSGGVVGVAGFPAMVAGTPRPSLEQFIAHIDALVEQVGIAHVGLGLDYYRLQAGVATEQEANRYYEQFIKSGYWTPAYPPPPHYYPKGIEDPRSLLNLTAGLRKRGYREADVRQILGENWLRVMRMVWG